MYGSRCMVLIVIVLVIGYQMILNRAFDNACGNGILAESVSPNGSKKFVGFQRSCGPMTGFSTQLPIQMRRLDNKRLERAIQNTAA